MSVGRKLLCLCTRVQLKINVIIIKGKSLLNVPRRIYGRLLTERLMKLTEGKVSEEQGGFRKEKDSMDQTFGLKNVAEEYLVKDKNLSVAFMNQGKAFDKAHREIQWNVLKIWWKSSY